jgi:hypothetical protein
MSGATTAHSSSVSTIVFRPVFLCPHHWNHSCFKGRGLIRWGEPPPPRPGGGKRPTDMLGEPESTGQASYEPYCFESCSQSTVFVPPLTVIGGPLTWISQTYRCIGAENLRKMLCCNSFYEVEESPDADRVYAAEAV